MTTNWTLPNTIQQYSEIGAEDIHVNWLDVDNFNNIKTNNGKSVRLTKDLRHIARDPKHDITNKTYYLKCTNFNFQNLSNSLNGIELKITMNRFGRATDDTIQLCLNGNLIGQNKASLDLDIIKTYGGNNDIWNTNLQIADVLNSTFGVILRFRSHPNWPHSSNVLIDAVEIKVH